MLLGFSAFAIDASEIAGRLAVIVPAAVALTALQVLVVATDTQAWVMQGFHAATVCFADSC